MKSPKDCGPTVIIWSYSVAATIKERSLPNGNQVDKEDESERQDLIPKGGSIDKRQGKGCKENSMRRIVDVRGGHSSKWNGPEDRAEQDYKKNYLGADKSY